MMNMSRMVILTCWSWGRVGQNFAMTSIFDFASPTSRLFEMLKGGLCEPAVALYQPNRACISFFKRRGASTIICGKTIRNFLQISDAAWQSCRNCGIQDKLGALKMMRSQKCFVAEKAEDIRTDSSSKREDSLRGMEGQGEEGTGCRSGYQELRP
ncbi:hypothetical protein Dimus_009056 [Dionaea muscipula]